MSDFFKDDLKDEEVSDEVFFSDEDEISTDEISEDDFDDSDDFVEDEKAKAVTPRAVSDEEVMADLDEDASSLDDAVEASADDFEDETDAEDDYESVCFVCRRPESVTGKQFKLPNSICVCNDCMHKTMDMVSQFDYQGMLPPEMFGDMRNWDFNSMMQGFLPPDLMQAMGFGGYEEAEEDEDDSEGVESAGSDSDNAGSAAEGDATRSSNNADADASTDGSASGNNTDSANKGSSTTGAAAVTPDNPNKNNPNKSGKSKPVPTIRFVNITDLQGRGGIPNKQKLKKKRVDDKPLIELKDIPAPHKIKAQLDEYIVGQEKAKKVLSVAVYNHYKRVATHTMNDIEIEKSNVLMLGPTGCGKTYLVKTLARILNVPLAITDATSLTEAGYIGDDIESVISKLLAAADNDVAKAEMGIVFIDEIDKIAKKRNTHNRDVSGESVQQGMLKLLEGAEVEVPVGANSKNAMVPLTTVNTRNILFVCGGAFPDLDEIIIQRLSKQSSIGFNATLKDAFDKDKNIHTKVKPEDLREFGMIPEFLGRLPVVCTLEGMTEDMMVEILTQPKNAILKQYQKLLDLDEVKLDFDEDALRAIAKKAMEQETGARALRAIIEEAMLDIMYEVPKDDNIGSVTLTGDYIEGKGGPTIEMRV